MKTFTLASALVLFVSLCSYAKIWRVNNNPGVTANFTTIQAAHDGAASGDTLHVESSPNSYGYLTATKKLVIIGPGYFLSENSNLQVFPLTAQINGIQFNVGAEGSVVMGMDFGSNSIYVYCNDIVIKRNKCVSPNGSDQDWVNAGIYLYYTSNDGSKPVTNIIISQNYGPAIFIYYPSTGVLITNNYITSASSGGDVNENISLDIHSNAVALLQNNIFRRGKIRAYNSNLTNNIMYSGVVEGTGNLVSNNLANGTQFGTTNGNKANVNMATVFLLTGSPDGQWKLKAGSPAIGAGFGSTVQNPIDAGMYGGNTPYVLSGLPPVPSVYAFENQPVGSASDPIDVTIKVRANN